MEENVDLDVDVRCGGKVDEEGVGVWMNCGDELVSEIETRRWLREIGERGGDGGVVGYSSFGVELVCLDLTILTWGKMESY